jgi:hypothetical protein
MIAMAVQDDWVPVEKAAEIAGCTPQYLRRILDHSLPRDASGKITSDRTSGGRVDGWRVNGKAWLVLKSSATALRETLSTRATANRKKAPAVGRRKVAKRKKPR